jgi:Bardet-Biedl syndrome 7 protein
VYISIVRTEVNHRWILNDGKHRAGVLCMDCYDMSGDGVLDLLIGRRDGTLDIFSLGDDAGEEGKLSQRFSYVSVGDTSDQLTFILLRDHMLLSKI